MEIIRGSLDDISRPASSEQTGSRVSSVSLAHSDKICPTPPFALVVLSNDAADIPVQSFSEETMVSSSASGSGQGQCQSEGVDEEEEDSELQRAAEEMRRLDELLCEVICREKEAKRQRKELQTKLWQELLQSKPEGHSESAHEALNTRLYLALEALSGTEEEEEDNFVPVFETQVPDHDCDRDEHNRHLENFALDGAMSSGNFRVTFPLQTDDGISSNSAETFETEEEQAKNSHLGPSRGKRKQRDFVRRNIELASDDGDQMHLTQAERRRLAELLQQIDKEEEEEVEDSARGADSEEDMWAVSVLTGQGYTPEPSDLQQLIDIDSKMRLLLPVEEFLSAQSSYTNFGLTQGHGSDVGWKCGLDPQPGEKVLQDGKERRGQERRLQEIQQQLELLGQSPEMTSESRDLTEEQLLTLLDECDLTESWSQDHESHDTTQ